VEPEPLSQMYNLWVDIDVVENICDEAIFLAELRSIIQEVATLFQCQTEVTNYVRQSGDIVPRWSEDVEAINF
jgi:hypothetical protein